MLYSWFFLATRVILKFSAIFKWTEEIDSLFFLYYCTCKTLYQLIIWSRICFNINYWGHEPRSHQQIFLSQTFLHRFLCSQTYFKRFRLTPYFFFIFYSNKKSCNVHCFAFYNLWKSILYPSWKSWTYPIFCISLN